MTQKWTLLLRFLITSRVLGSNQNRYTARIGLFGIVAALALGFSGPAATAQKVGYVASNAIFERLPQAIEARAKLAEMQGKWSREILLMEQKIVKLRDEIERNRLLWSAQERTQNESDLRDAEAKLVTYRSEKFGPNGEFETQYRALMAPVIELVSVAVTAEAVAQEYDYVFDKSSRGLPMLFASPDYDLTYSVLKRLGVEVDASELETRTDKDFQILPGNIPIDLGKGGNIQIEPQVQTTTNFPAVNAELPQSNQVEANPNKFLVPAQVPVPAEEAEAADPR